METIKTENKVESDLLEKKICKIRMCLEEINLSLLKSSTEVALLLEYFLEHRDEVFLWDLMFDVVERMRLAVASSVEFEKSFY